MLLQSPENLIIISVEIKDPLLHQLASFNENGDNIVKQSSNEDILTRLTLEEKVSLLAGADLWHTVPIERLGIPSIKITDGPIGVRGSQGSSSPSSTCFPSPVAMAATWDPELIGRVGSALAEEVKDKGAHILLAPTVNIHRSPLAGRHFECFSEDPYLTARMAVAYINGLQGQGVGACIKHFVCNDSEYERMSISSEVDERTLREIYLLPFEAAIREARPWAVMSAYNKLNGTYCSENGYLLLEILKEEWGFDGIVMSDWGGTYSHKAAKGGLDLEMPGPARWMGEEVMCSLENGEITEGEIDDKVCRLLNTIRKACVLEGTEITAEKSVDRPEHRRLAQEVAAESIVLLKNDGILPLDAGKLNSIAIIGENAKWAQLMGGGSSAVVPHYSISPLDAIRSQVGDRLDVHYELGCPVHKSLPVLDIRTLYDQQSQRNGYTLHLFDNLNLSGEPLAASFIDRSWVTFSDELLSPVDPSEFSARMMAVFTPQASGKYAFSLTGNGINRLLVDGELLIDHWDESEVSDKPPWDEDEHIGEIELEHGRDYHLTVEYGWSGSNPWRLLRIGCWPPAAVDPIQDAVELAARCDVAVVFAGLTSEWESEGFDRADMELRGDQVDLIRRVAKANSNTVVVLNTGSPITMDWLEQVPAVLQMWYAGQEGGSAIAQILLGSAEPGGRLTTTYPRRLLDNSSYINYPGENGRVYYGEGIFVGYRYYDKKGVEPLFPFGYGLSYTSFSYRDLSINAPGYAPGDPIHVSLVVQNSGDHPGKEVVQLYVRDVESSLVRPEKELKAFEKIDLQPGEAKTVTFTLDQRALSFYDPARKKWVAEEGEYEILVGSSSREIHLVERFTMI